MFVLFCSLFFLQGNACAYVFMSPCLHVFEEPRLNMLPLNRLKYNSQHLVITMTHFQGRIMSLGCQGGNPSLTRPKREETQLSILDKRCFALAHGPLLQHTMRTSCILLSDAHIVMGSLMGLNPSLFSLLFSLSFISFQSLLLSCYAHCHSHPSIIFSPRHLRKCKDPYPLSFSFSFFAPLSIYLCSSFSLSFDE